MARNKERAAGTASVPFGTARRTIGHEGESEVLGVLIMIIVGLVMAAAIFIGWNLYFSDVQKAPNVGMTASETDDHLGVVLAERGADWHRIGMRATDASGSATSIHVGDATNVVGVTATADGANILNTLGRVNQSPLAIASSDTVSFCAVGGASDVTVDVIDVDANRKLGSWHFATIRSC